MEKEAGSAEDYLFLEKAAHAWKSGKGELWGGVNLEFALEWKQREQPTPEWAKRYGTDFDLAMNFLDESEKKRKDDEEASQREAEQKLKVEAEALSAIKMRRVTHAVLVLLVMMTFLATFAFFKGKEAGIEASISRSRELASNADFALETDPTLSFRLAEAAIRHFPTYEAERILGRTFGYPLHNVLRGHKDSVASAEFSPDGSRIVTASRDTTARIWDSATGKELHTLSGHESFVRSAEFSPDGSKVVTASRDKTARIWDTATGKELHTLSGHKDDLWSAEFSPDGSRIVTASDDKTARVWDSATGKELHTLSGHENSVYSAEFSPDGSRIVTASDDKTARVWDSATGKELHTLSGHESFVLSAEFSPDGSRIVTASRDKTARIWDSATGKEIHTLFKQVRTALLDDVDITVGNPCTEVKCGFHTKISKSKPANL